MTQHPGLAAGWSSPVARQAHNLKVAGSNPAPAPKHHKKKPRQRKPAGLFAGHTSGQNKTAQALNRVAIARDRVEGPNLGGDVVVTDRLQRRPCILVAMAPLCRASRSAMSGSPPAVGNRKVRRSGRAGCLTAIRWTR